MFLLYFTGYYRLFDAYLLSIISRKYNIVWFLLLIKVRHFLFSKMFALMLLAGIIACFKWL